MSEERIWHISAGGATHGPLKYSEIKKALEWFKVDGDTVVWKEGWQEWKKIKECPEFKETLSAIPAAPPARRYKDKQTAALLAIILGATGAHRFYLGQKRGLIYPLFTAILYAQVETACSPSFYFFPGIIAALEGVAFLTASKARWDKLYNSNEWGVYYSGTAIGTILATVFFVTCYFLTVGMNSLNYNNSCRRSCGQLRSDLANLSLLQEEYFAANKKYFNGTIKMGVITGDGKVLEGIIKGDNGESVFEPGKDIAIVITTGDDKASYVAVGTHPLCDKEYTWDSKQKHETIGNLQSRKVELRGEIKSGRGD
ncbi:MAG: DUF4339 domain-containing protein [Nitrospinae bacterium]|nr:DUF4339 domain-containing protein [Nitrospinota bacterium]